MKLVIQRVKRAQVSIDQQLRITRIMIDSVDLPDAVAEKKLEHYMENYLSMMMCICSTFLRMHKKEEDEAKLRDIWRYLEERNPVLYKRVRHNVLNIGANLPTEAGRVIGQTGYKMAQKIFKFN